MRKNRILKIIITLAALVGSFKLLYYIFGEIAVYYEMWSTGTPNRTELSNDFGLGLLGIFVVLPASMIFSIVIGALVWRWLSTSNHEHEGNA